ncbi:hypothetical protein DB88DRAFT_496076 [Papiliotrema laurentii]|uniref:Monopolin complex subunit Csm1/Pcs1 C-terminal domain-containing protein n=1 Tax=Papiliotrema laurentii TaxID=5418 RepID=A0AAD9CWB2_PAPLA|nr:hypothetical protein DB88DRAFT_496076 [Papiliotrema laurentii]
MAAVSKTKKAGKENIPPSDGADEPSGVEAPSTSKEGRRAADLERRLQALTAERDRLRSQRDEFGRQFEELSKTRNTEVEALFEKYKEKAAVQAKAQNDIISNQTALTERLQGKIRDLEKALEKATALPSAGGPFDAVKADPKEVKALKEELTKAKATIKATEEKFVALEREYKAEVKHSQNLQASRSGTAPAAGVVGGITPEEAAKDAACLRLYEDLSDLSVPNVKIRDTGKAGKEIVYNCIQTYAGRSLNFKIKTFNVLDAAKAKAKDPNPWEKKVQYNPEGLEMEPADFVNRLGVFGKEFTIPREQMSEMYEELRTAIAAEE